MKKLMKIGEFAKAVGVSASTLRRMSKEGTLVPAYTAKSKFRYYTEDQAAQFSLAPQAERITVGYCRVSAPNQKNDLNSQVESLKTYMIAKGYRFEIITDIGSSIDYKKDGLKELISKICQRKVDRVVVLCKDRLVRFGYEILEYVSYLHGCEIEIIDNTDESKEEELCEDLQQIVTFFANRIFGKRSKKAKILIQTVKKNITSCEDFSDI